MSALSTSITFHSTTDAAFRIWGKAISDRLAAGGWVQTGDSGQINWATVTTAALANTLQGYEIWRSADAGGGLVEMYMKFEYGSGTTQPVPGVRLTFGTGSNGSGTITGVYGGSSWYFANSGTAGTGAATQNLSAVGGGTAGTSFISLFMHQGSSTGNMFGFWLERTRDASGNLLNEWSAVTLTGSTWWNRVFNSTRIYHDSISNGASIQSAANAIYDGVVGLGITQPSKAGYLPPLMGFFGVNNTQLGVDNSIVSITSYGAAHNYIVNTNVAGASRYFWHGISTTQIVSRFE